MGCGLNAMNFQCIAIVGKENNPLYIQTFSGADELKFHYIVHTSLDVVEEKVAAKQHQGNGGDTYLGLLYPTEDYHVYGYMTSTGVKLILVLSDTGADTAKTKQFLQDFHALYCDTVCNPFYTLGTPITSNRFKAKLEKLLAVK